MAFAQESNLFKQQKLANMNPLVNGKYTWQADPKLEREKNAVFERVAYELNSGILQQLRLKRERDLNPVIAEQCFADDFNYL